MSLSSIRQRTSGFTRSKPRLPRKQVIVAFGSRYPINTKQRRIVQRYRRPRTIHDKPQEKPTNEKICEHIRKQEWSKLVPYVDDLIMWLESGISIPSYKISLLLDSTMQDYEIMNTDLFVKDIVQTISTYLKEIIAYERIGKRSMAILIAKKCKEILEAAEEITIASKKEELLPLSPSDIEQIDVIEGIPIYALK
jgi:hypothetical protein